MALEAKTYKVDKVKLEHNRKTGEVGTIDVIRGCCGCELRNAPCYAAKCARMTGIDFFHPVRRLLDLSLLERQLKRYSPDWVRIGCISDPSLDWDSTCSVCQVVRQAGKTPVVITKVHRFPSDSNLASLSSSKAIVQVTLSALQSTRAGERRWRLLKLSGADGLVTASRIVSAAWRPERLNRRQDGLVTASRELGLPIVDTPLRLFRTSPLWKLVDQTRYSRHRSPLSGKMDSQLTAGTLIEGAYACFSSCSPTPTATDPVGCPHQCLTRGRIEEWA